MTGLLSRRPAVTGFAIFTLVMVAIFAGLGIWQLQRRVEKHALIARLNERLAAAPAALPAQAQWGALTPAKDEFRRVSFTATYAPLPDAMVYSAGSAVRDDVSGPGTWAFLPSRLADGNTIVVNTGFVQNTMQDRNQQDRAARPLITGDPVQLTGYIRFPESAAALTPPESAAKRLWFTRAAGVSAARPSRRSMSIWKRRCPRAAFQSPARFPCVLRTITCNTPSLGSRWRLRSSSRSVCGGAGSAAPKFRPVFTRTSLLEPLFRTIV
jgi:cytochrome oxidase assembly protein ShyY1